MYSNTLWGQTKPAPEKASKLRMEWDSYKRSTPRRPLRGGCCCRRCTGFHTGRGSNRGGGPFPRQWRCRRPPRPQVTSGDSRDDASGGVDAADGVVFGIHDDNVVMPVAADGLGRAPCRGQRGTAVASIASLTVTGQGGHDAVAVHFSHPVAFPLGYVGYCPCCPCTRRGRPECWRL